MSISSQVYARSIVLGGSTEAQARGQLIWARSLFADLYEKIPHLRTGAGGRILDASDMRAFLAEVCAEIDRLTDTEYEDAVGLANKVLDRISADPDDDLAILARQFLRARERELNLYVRALRLSRDCNQVVGGKGDYYVTLDQLERLVRL